MFAAFLAAMVLIAVAFTGCGKDSDNKGGGGANSVEWDPSKTVHPDQEGAAVLIVTGDTGTPWTAEITSGAEWISFNRTAPGGQTVKTGKVGTSLSDKNQYVYYWPNNTKDERHALIRFEFEGEMPVELELVQYSTSSNDNVYETGHNLVWPEIPAEKVNSNYIYVSHFAQLKNQNTNQWYNARNYTLCLDKTKYAAWWVAYPLHSSYTGSGRVETWAYDPKIAAEYQANLTRSYPAANYDRGHQIPNADRSGNATMQAQTFYFSNMTPQNSSLNQHPWADLEKMARDHWMCSDTLYVVTGAYWKPGSTLTTADRDGKLCPVPNYYFKVFVRTVKGNIRQAGDKLGDYSAGQLKSIGFWVENASGQGEAKSWVKSVKEIEELTKFEFFPTLPAEVKEKTDAASWGL